MTRNIFSIAIIAIIFVFTSCDKEEVTNNKAKIGYEVKDGYLVFKNNESFIKSITNISSMNRDERENWEKSIGFTSQTTLITTLIDDELNLDSINRIKFADGDISKATKYDFRPVLFYNLLTKGVIKLIDEGTPNEYWDFSAYNKSFSNFINEDGLFSIGDTIFQVANTELRKVKSFKYDDINQLKAVLTTQNEIKKIKKTATLMSATQCPGLIESQWVQNNRWPKTSQRIKLGMDLTFLSYSYSTAQFDFSHNYYVTCQSTNFWNKWINDYAYYTVQGRWWIRAYRFDQLVGDASFNYTGSAINGAVNPFTGQRMNAGTTFYILPDEANQTYDYAFQRAHEPYFMAYKWIVYRNDTGQSASLLLSEQIFN
jgi:hypothetical protein